VPPAGEQVLVQRNGNLSNDVTDQVHPENAAAAVLAAKTVGLDVAGVDMVADDISRPLRLQGGAVVEVNAGPGLQMHLQPGTGLPRPVGKLIVASLFPPDATGRIPLVAVSGGSDRTMIARLVSHLLHVAGVRTGLACAAGTYANGQPLRDDNAADARSAADLLLHPLIEAAVFETPEAGVVRDGLGFDRCQVAVMAEGGPAETAAHSQSPASQDEIAAARQALLGTLESDGAVVVAAESAWASARPTPCAGEVMLFAEQPTHLAVRTQRERGEKAVFVRGTSVLAAHGDQEELLADLVSTDLRGPAIRSSVLASVAAAWALHISAAAIQSGLNSFVLDRE
jgi:cyanophycin synthetase